MSRRRRDPHLNNRVLIVMQPPPALATRMKAISAAARLGWDDTAYSLSQLQRLGLVAKQRVTGYFLTPKGSAELERLRRLTGEQPPDEGALEQRFWAAMRIERKWTHEALLGIAALPSDDNAGMLLEHYQGFLEEAGIIKRLPEFFADPAAAPRWRLARNLGVIAPTYRPSLGLLYDWNANEPIVVEAPA